MQNFLTYLSTAPVLTFFTLVFFSGIIIEINRFFPDGLMFPYI